MWPFGRKTDRRDELIADLLAAVNKMHEIGTFLNAENDMLRRQLKEIETDWRNCIDPDREQDGEIE